MVSPSACPAPLQGLVRDALYLGRDVAGGAEVSDSSWQAFLDSEVTPRFPDGATVLAGSGRWRDAAQRTVQERSWILLLYHAPAGTADSAVAAIAEAYKQRFSQEAVLRDRSLACVSF